MSLEEKAEVAIDRLAPEQACEIFASFGFSPRSAERLYGGYASSNFKVVGSRKPEGETETFLLKINYYALSLEDLEHQIFVLRTLRPTGFPTNYLHAAPDGRMIVESDGRRALLLDFINGVSGAKLLARGEAYAPVLLRGLAGALARLHQVVWPAEPKVRDVRSGYPVCSTGDILKGEELARLEGDERFARHPMVAFCRRHLEWLRQLYDRDVPWGLIHGDGFLDNTLYTDVPEGRVGECVLLGLIDWEDSCVGPLVLDLAVSASACCFTAANELLKDRLAVLLAEYHAQRRLSARERSSLADFMAAGALACAFYRFTEFNVRQADSDEQAKASYQLHTRRAELLLDGGGARAVVEATVAELGA